MTVILLDPRRPTLIPVEALELLDGPVVYTEELSIKVVWALRAGSPLGSASGVVPRDPGLPASEPAGVGESVEVLLSSDPSHSEVTARIALGERVIAAPAPVRGERVLDAVAMMDTLRIGGPWEREQTHESLLRYLLEETYELFDAVRAGDATELRGELGDLLLQVLFQARIAEDATEDPFDIDGVAEALIVKLRNRAPSVLAGEQVTLEQQLEQWEQRKALEKSAKSARSAKAASVLDGIPTALPALALAQKVIGRARQADLPEDLIPEALNTISLAEHEDAENHVRTLVLEFMDDVRAAEAALARTGEPYDETQWRAAWPAGPTQANSVEPQ